MIRAILFVVLLCAGCAVANIPAGINIDPTNPGGNPSPADVAALGAKWVRMEFKVGSAGFASALALYKSSILAFNEAGIGAIVILDYETVASPPWGGSALQWAAYAATFASTAQSVAQSFGTLTYQVEVWNEPDLQSTNIPPASYGPLLQATYRAIKSQNKGVTVLFGGLASGNPQYVSQAAAATGGVLYCDAIAIHPYGQRPYPNWPSPTWGFGYVGSLLQSYDAVAQSKPLVITEFGVQNLNSYPTFPWMFFSGVADIASQTRLQLAVWFCWSDAMVNGFGLLAANGDKKSAYYSYVNYTKN